MDEEQARGALIEVCQRLYARGWVANHDGNLSVRVGDDRIVATPTAVSKGDVRPEQLIVVDLSGKKLEGTRKSFSELALHLRIYRARPDAKAVIHAHPVTATGFAVAGLEVLTTCMAEPVVSLGDRIPTVPFAPPYGDEGAAPLEPYLEDYDAFLLEQHGVLTQGPDLWTAYYRLELVEHLARIQQVARGLGGVKTLSPEVVKSLLERRKAAGLGPEARGRTRSVAWSAPVSSDPPRLPEGAAPSAWMGSFSPAPAQPAAFEEPPALSKPVPSKDELSQLVARELSRVLGR